MLGRIKQTDLSVPTRRGGYLYYSRTEEGKQYPIQCRRKGTMDAPEEVLLDLNELGKDKKFVGLGGFVVSDDQNLLAYTIDYTGFRQYALHVKDLRTGQTLPDTTERVTSLAWAADNKTLFLTTEDAVTKRSDKLWRHVLGTREVRAALRREGRALRYRRRQDARQEVPVPARSRPRTPPRCATCAPTGQQDNFRRVSAAREGPPLLRRSPRRAVLHPHQQERPQFRRDDGAGERSGSARTGRSSWRTATTCASRTSICSRISRCRWRNREALDHLRVYNFKTGAWTRDRVSGAGLFGLPGRHAGLRIARPTATTTRASSRRPSVFDYDMLTGKSTLLKQQEVLGGYDPTQYVSERLWATARDGVKVPISIVYKKGFARDGKAPLFLYGYGSLRIRHAGHVFQPAG